MIFYHRLFSYLSINEKNITKKNMSEIIFKSACPIMGCINNEIQTWHHTGCPSDSHEYISDQAIVRCDYCGKKWDFFATQFNCNHGGDKSEKPCLRKALNVFSCLAKENEISVDFYFRLVRSLMDQAKKYE